jgi:hypothetical protein
VLGPVERAIGQIFRGCEAVLQLHPDDIGVVEEAIGRRPRWAEEIENLRVQPTNEVRRGGCRLLSGAGVVDVTLDGQLELIGDALAKASTLGLDDRRAEVAHRGNVKSSGANRAAVSSDAVIDEKDVDSESEDESEVAREEAIEITEDFVDVIDHDEGDVGGDMDSEGVKPVAEIPEIGSMPIDLAETRWMTRPGVAPSSASSSAASRPSRKTRAPDRGAGGPR